MEGHALSCPTYLKNQHLGRDSARPSKVQRVPPAHTSTDYSLSAVRDSTCLSSCVPDFLRNSSGKIRCLIFADIQKSWRAYGRAMSKRNFRVMALSSEVARAARSAAATNAPDHRIVVAESDQSCPCRHCLEWGRRGERMVLFPYDAIPPGHPYSERGPIFVHERQCIRYAETNEYPDAFRNGRVFRAYNAGHDMIDAQPADGGAPEAIIENLLQNPETAFVDARSATHGCFTFRLERA